MRELSQNGCANIIFIVENSDLFKFHNTRVL